MDKARIDALAEVNSLISDSASLSIDHVLDAYRSDYRASRAQLKRAVDARLAAASDATRLLRLARAESARIRTAFETTALSEAATSRRLSKADRAKARRLTTCRANLTAVLTNVDVFHRIPSECGALLKILESQDLDASTATIVRDGDEDDDALYRVFSRYAVLFKWKEALEKTALASSDGSKSTKSKRFVQEQFASLDEVDVQIKRSVRARAANLLELAQFAPQKVLSAFRIVELTCVLERSPEMRTVLFEDIVESCRKRTRDLGLSAEEPLVEQSSSSSFERLEITLNRATLLLMDLKVVAVDVYPLAPSAYKILHVYRNAYEETLETFFAAQVEHLQRDQLCVAQNSLALLSWLVQYNETLPSLLPEDQEGPNEAFGEHCDVLYDAYVRQALPRLNTWIAAVSVGRVNALKRTHTNYLYTDVPEDLFDLLHREMDVVKDRVRGEYTTKFYRRLLAVVGEFQRQNSELLNKGVRAPRPNAKKQKSFLGALSGSATSESARRSAQGSFYVDGATSIETVLSFVNDYDRCQILCDQLLQRALKLIETTAVTSNVDGDEAHGRVLEDDDELLESSRRRAQLAQEETEEVFSNFARDSKAACDLVVDEFVFSESLRDVFAQIWSLSWETSEVEHSRVVASTLADYVHHEKDGIVVWLNENDFLIGKMLRRVLDACIVEYLSPILCIKTTPFASRLRVGGRLADDYDVLLEFFQSNLGYLKYGGIRSRAQLERKLSPLSALAKMYAVDDTSGDVAEETYLESFEELADAFGGGDAAFWCINVFVAFSQSEVAARVLQAVRRSRAFDATTTSSVFDDAERLIAIEKRSKNLKL